MNGTEIPVVDHFRYLGVTVDAKGTLLRHAKELLRKANGLISSYFQEFTSNELTFRTKVELMNSAVLSVVRYAEELHDEKVMEELEKAQNKATRLILGEFNNQHPRNDVSLAILGQTRLGLHAKTAQVLAVSRIQNTQFPGDYYRSESFTADKYHSAAVAQATEEVKSVLEPEKYEAIMSDDALPARTTRRKTMYKALNRTSLQKSREF